MAGLREISGRIRSVRDTMKITNAMYMISSTKLRKAKKDAELNNPYFEAMQEMLINIMNTSDHLEHPYTDRRTDKKREDRIHAVIVVTADKGLAGAYNQNVIKKVSELMKMHDESKLFVVGEYGRQYFESHHIPIEKSFVYSIK